MWNIGQGSKIVDVVGRAGLTKKRTFSLLIEV